MNNFTTVITVTFNNERTIKKCLDSVTEDFKDVEIVVVDNNSSDKTIKVLKKYGNRINLIESDVNLGFSKANNLAVKKANGKYLIFLNPDTRIIEENTIKRLYILLQENPDYALAGPKIKLTNGLIQKSVRKLPTLMGAVKEYIFRIKGSYEFYLPDCHKLCEVESVVGACMCIEKELFLKLGGFDERFFLFFEDLQLCKNLRERGFKIGFATDITIEHGLGISGAKADTASLSLKSSKIYFGTLTFLLIEYIGRIGNKLFKK